MNIKQMAGSIRIMHKELLWSAGATFRFPDDLDFLYRSIPTDTADIMRSRDVVNLHGDPVEELLPRASVL